MAESVHLAGGNLVVGHIFNIWMLRLTYLFILLIVPFYFLWCSISQVALMGKGVLPAALWNASAK